MSIDHYIHASLPGEPGGPLLFAFHGTGGDENQLMELARDVAPQATIISPRGDVSEQGAARFFRRTGEGVYDMDDLARATAKMAAFVQAHVEAAKPSAVLGIGYSNGANILASVLFADPDLFDRAALMHPLIPFEPQVKGSLAGKQILITAGRRDPICPPTLTNRLDAHLRATAAAVTLDWHEGGHELRPNEIEAARRLFAAVDGAGRGMQDNPAIELEEGASKGRYVVRGPNGAEAEMTFSKAGNGLIIIDHTEVPDAFRGQGIGLKLVTRAVEDARKSSKKIIPLCPFAKAQFQRPKDWADVLKQ
jgi:phospholipase/carboxylesterase